jgi:hypothetical protein
MTWRETKEHERREVPLPLFLIDDLSRQVAGRSPHDLVFTGPRGAMFSLAPPAGFEPALPPPESQRTMIWHDWNSTKPQVSPDFDALALLAVLGRFRFWCCQSVAKAPSRN